MLLYTKQNNLEVSDVKSSSDNPTYATYLYTFCTLNLKGSLSAFLHDEGHAVSIILYYSEDIALMLGRNTF